MLIRPEKKGSLIDLHQKEYCATNNKLEEMKKRNSQVLNFLSIAGNIASGSIIQASGAEEENIQTIHLAPLETLQLSVRDT